MGMDRDPPGPSFAAESGITRLRSPAPPVRIGMKPIEQNIAVPYAFPVAFTRDLFGAGDEALSRTLEDMGPLLPHPLLVYLDDGLARA